MSILKKVSAIFVVGIAIWVFAEVISYLSDTVQAGSYNRALNSFNKSVQPYVVKCFEAGGRWVWKIQHQELDNQSQTLIQGTCFMPEPDSQQKAQEPNDNAEKL